MIPQALRDQVILERCTAVVLRFVIKAERKEEETMGENEEKLSMVKQKPKTLDKIFTTLNA